MTRALLAAAALALLLPAAAKASFDANQTRYAAPYDVLQTLKRLFPPADPARKDYVPRGCAELDESNRPVSGDSLPATGRPAIAQPSGGFVRWYSTCLTDYVNASTSGEASPRLFGPAAAAWFKAHPKDGAALPWKRLGEKERADFLRDQIERMIGPEEVVAGFGLCRGDAELSRQIEGSFDGSESVLSALRKAMIFLGLRDEFLSY